MPALKPLVIYHGACRDGWCAAWVIHRHPDYTDAEFVPGFYGQPPPDVAGRHVVIADFCYPREQMKVIAARALSLLVYDHHKTAPPNLEGLAGTLPGAIIFDNTRSGAGITWDELFAGPRPWLVSYVEDRDLWKHQLNSTHEINAYIATLEFNFAVWDRVHDNVAVSIAMEYGQVALAKTAQYVREVAKNARRVMFQGQMIPCVNAPQCDISELLNALDEDAPMAMGWFQRADGMFVYSLRTRRDDLDVSEIAKKFGGGGHAKSSGFQVSEMLKFE